jgi:hypothetical protein
MAHITTTQYGSKSGFTQTGELAHELAGQYRHTRCGGSGHIMDYVPSRMDHYAVLLPMTLGSPFSRAQIRQR